ncbi:hypothetical protein PHMEG_00020697 [Phytophthora megakarya]|uniref:Uncharacterized protein n=1 Tax=Phytophthora megakarya TaxID=4795 RepID=A0A225VNQ7_9STRA|nr:hypothetical protein PHMEG_00020697 [Phytophthora megakarya]
MSHKVAELVEQKELTLNYVPTADNIAAMFTKALGPQRFNMLRQLLGVEDVAQAVASTGLSERLDREDDQ